MKYLLCLVPALFAWFAPDAIEFYMTYDWTPIALLKVYLVLCMAVPVLYVGIGLLFSRREGN